MKREVYALVEHHGDVWPEDFHALRQLSLRHTEFRHPQEYLAQECRADMIDNFQVSLEFTAASRRLREMSKAFSVMEDREKDLRAISTEVVKVDNLMKKGTFINP